MFTIIGLLYSLTLIGFGVLIVVISKMFYKIFFGKKHVRNLWLELCEYKPEFIRESLGFRIEKRED